MKIPSKLGGSIEKFTDGIYSMFLRNNSRKSFYAFSLLILLISANYRLPASRSVLAETLWSPPQTIPLYHHDTWPPVLIADQNRTVHALSSQWLTLEGSLPVLAVFYNQWTLERGWTIPVDIIILPGMEARLTDAHLDKNGILHVVFWGGDSTGADIYYSNAPVSMAGMASAWSLPIVIGRSASDPENAVFTEDSQGNLFIVYASQAIGNGLYVVKSENGGESWSAASPIYSARSAAPIISQIQTVEGKDGTLHLIWNVYNLLSQGRGIYYSQSMDGSQWSEPILLADAQDGLGTQTPRLTEHNEMLIAFYNVSIKIVMRISNDGGQTWGDPSFVFPRHVGVNGSLSLVTDSNNVLHLFFGQRIPGPPDLHGMWHSTFVNNRWTEPEGIVKGPKVLDLVGYSGFDPNAARAVVSQGNVLLVTWRTDPGSVGNGVWFSYKKLDASELPVTPWPDLTSNVSDTVPTENPDQILSTPVNEIVRNTPLADEGPPTVLTPGSVLAITLVTVILFLVMFFVSVIWKRSS